MASPKLKLRDLFTQRLRQMRMEAGLSQRELGRRIGLLEEVVSSRVTRYELGTSEPDFETAGKLARELGVPLAYLLADDEALAEIILAVSKLPAVEQRKLAQELKGRSTTKPSQ